MLCAPGFIRKEQILKFCLQMVVLGLSVCSITYIEEKYKVQEKF